MRSTFAGPPALPWPAAAPGDLQRVQLARRRFFASGEPPRGEVQTAVWQSWQRCVQAGLQPEHCPEFQPVGRGKVRYLVDRDHLLLKAAQAPLDELQTVLAHSGCKLLLTDREGLVLRVTPALDSDGAVLRTAGRVGVDLGELMVGTTAPGMVARDGCPCALTAGEHFYEVLGGMRCVAAPIRNNQGTVVAVLDLSVEDRPFGFDALWLVRSYAGAIENRLRIAQTRQQVLLRLHSSPGALAGPAVGLAAVDAHGRIAWLNGLAAALTGCPTQAQRLLRCEELLGCDLDQVLAYTAERGPRQLLLPNGLTVWLRAEFRPLGEAQAADEAPPPSPAASVVAAAAPQTDAPTLAQLSRQLIEQTLGDCRGNLSLAARRLGVSRGLLYRRLRSLSEPR